jgi:hypothetical protein
MDNPERPYDPDKIKLPTKIHRHLRRKGWVLSLKSELWIDPRDGSAYSFRRAVTIQLGREE